MKKFTLTVLAALLLTAQAHAAPVYFAKLTRFATDLNLSSQRIEGGTLEINLVDNTTQLTLERRFHCPAGRVCIMMMPLPLVFKLPLTATVTDACGNTTYTAVSDQRPRDGSLQKLTIRDFSRNRCNEFNGRADTEISFDTESSGMGGKLTETHSNFDAERLTQVKL